MSQQLAFQLDVPPRDKRLSDDTINALQDSSVRLCKELPAQGGLSTILRAFFSFSVGFLAVITTIIIAGFLPAGRVPVLSWSSIQERTSSLVQAMLYEREVHIAENLLPLERLISVELDVSRNNMVWNLSSESILEQLIHLPLFEQLALERCSWFSFRCFRLTGILRSPRFRADLDGVLWLVDKAGRFLTPANQYQESPRSLDISELPELGGLSRFRSSPELLQVLSRKLISVVDTVARGEYSPKQTERSAPQLRVLSITLNEAGDILLELSDFPVPILLSGQRLERSELRKVANDLQSLRALPGDAFDGVQQIDLRFAGMAVYLQEKS